MSTNLIIIYSILSVFVFVIGFYLWFVLDVLIRGHDLSSDKKARQALCKIIAEKNPRARNFYDLGSGRGVVVLFVKKYLPHLQVHGIDLSRFRCALVKIKAMALRRDVLVQKNDLFKVNLADADIVYAYIWYDLLPSLEQKLQRELKPGAIVITNTVHFFDWPLSEKIVFDPKLPGDFGTLFVYVK